MIDFASLVRDGQRGGRFAYGVLANRADTTHFACMAGGSAFYPHDRLLWSRTHRIALRGGGPGGGPTRHEDVRCDSGGGGTESNRRASGAARSDGAEESVLCQPAAQDGCTDEVNLAVWEKVRAALERVFAKKISATSEACANLASHRR